MDFFLGFYTHKFPYVCCFSYSLYVLVWSIFINL